MSVGVVVEFDFKPGSVEKATEILAERFPQVRSWAGCENIYLGIDDEDPNHAFLIEKWTSREQYARFREWAMDQPRTEELMSYLIGDMKTTYLGDAGV